MRSPRPAAGLAALLCALWARPAEALDPTHRLAELALRSWSGHHELSNATVQDLAQTPDGYLWVATLEGLVRFDGARFTTFDRANTPALPRNDVQALHVAKDGSLLLAAYGGGLVRRDGRDFRAVELPPGEGSETISAIAEGPGSVLLLGTATGVLAMGAGDALGPFPSGGRGPDALVHDVATDPLGTVFVATAEGLVRIRDGRTEAVPLPGGATTAFALEIVTAEEVLVGTELGLARVTAAGVALVVPTGMPVRAVLADRHGGIWLGAGDRLGRLQAGRLEWVSTADGLSPGGILALLEDREGSLWVGTTLGLTQVTLGPAVTYGSRAGLRDPELLTLAPGPGGHGVLVATARGSLSLFDGARFQSLGGELPFAGSRILSLLVDGDLLWVGTDKGLYLREGGRWRRDWHGQPLPRDSVRSLLRAKDGHLWVGTEGAGLIGLREGALRSFTRRDGLPSDQVRGLLERRDGSLLVATYGGVGELRSSEGPVFSLPGLRGVMARSLHQDDTGVLWVGTYGEGLLRVARGLVTAVTTREGLLSDVVYAILEEGPRLWLSCNRGVFAVTKSEVEAFAHGRARRVTSEAYGREDGMASEDCSGGFPSGLQDAQGRLFFPTGAGLVALDPARRTAGRAAPVPLFEEALVAGRRASLRGRLRVPPGGPRFEVRYTSVAFQASERTLFSYRLKGFETEWTDADRRRFATYTNVPAGRYQLEVRARTEGSDWQRADPPLEVVVETHWHARPEVHAAAVVLVGLALGLGYAARMRALGLREAELRERVDEEVARLKVLRGLLPICAGCKKIREGDGYWRQIEAYIRENSEADFSHGMCPECVREWFPDRSGATAL